MRCGCVVLKAIAVVFPCNHCTSTHFLLIKLGQNYLGLREKLFLQKSIIAGKKEKNLKCIAYIKFQNRVGRNRLNKRKERLISSSFVQDKINLLISGESIRLSKKVSFLLEEWIEGILCTEILENKAWRKKLGPVRDMNPRPMKIIYVSADKDVNMKAITACVHIHPDNQLRNSASFANWTSPGTTPSVSIENHGWQVVVWYPAKHTL